MKNFLAAVFAFVFLTFNVKAQSKSDTLYQSVDNNDRGYVIRLLHEGADVNHIKTLDDGRETTPLMAAVKKGNFDMAKLLIEHEADVNWSDDLQNTPLYYAAEKGSKDLVKLLLANGADIRAGSTGDHNKVLAAAQKSGNKDLVKFIEGRLQKQAGKQAQQ